MHLPNQPSLTNRLIVLSNLFWIIVVLILFVGNIFLGVSYLNSQKDLHQAQIALQAQKTNDKVLNFIKLFVQTVLQTQAQVDFETRLKLENAARDLGDQEILDQWQKFTDSKTEDEAQTDVKNLLELLVGKIHPR